MTKKKNNAEKSEPDLSFEQSYDELKEIVARLENGNLSLGDSLDSYETGIKRLKACYRALNQAEHKIKLLTKLDADGNLEMSDFDVDNDAEDSRVPSPRRKNAPKSRQPDDDGDSLF